MKKGFQSPNRTFLVCRCSKSIRGQRIVFFTSRVKGSVISLMKGITLDTRPQKTSRYSCKQTAHHPTTTVPDFEVSTFAGFADKRRIQNSLCLLFVVLHGRNEQNFQQQKNSDQRLKDCKSCLVLTLKTFLSLIKVAYQTDSQCRQ